MYIGKTKRLENELEYQVILILHMDARHNVAVILSL